MTLAVLIPVSPLDRAKGRLSDALSPGERSELSLATLHTVVGAATRAGLRPIVLTADAEVVAAVGSSAEIVPEDPRLRGLNAHLEHGLATLAEPEVLILHADLPLATSRALTTVVEAAPPAPSATIVRSPDGGTNAMLLRPPGRFPLRYGSNSAALHTEVAGEAGVPVAFVEAPTLELDLDTPDDLLTLLEIEKASGNISAAGQLLLDWRVEERLGGLAR